MKNPFEVEGVISSLLWCETGTCQVEQPKYKLHLTFSLIYLLGAGVEDLVSLPVPHTPSHIHRIPSEIDNLQAHRNLERSITDPTTIKMYTLLKQYTLQYTPPDMQLEAIFLL